MKRAPIIKESRIFHQISRYTESILSHFIINGRESMQSKRLWIGIAIALFGLLGCKLFTPQAALTPAPSGSTTRLATPSTTPGGANTGKPTQSPAPNSSGANLPNQSPAPDHFTLVKVPNSNANLTSLLAEQAALAQQAGRRPFVDFYADWCGPCKSLEKNLGDPAMVAAFDGTYLIQLNLDEWKDRLPAAGFRVPGIPAFYAINSQGKPTGRMITGAAWGEDIPANMAPPLQEFFQK